MPCRSQPLAFRFAAQEVTRGTARAGYSGLFSAPVRALAAWPDLGDRRCPDEVKMTKQECLKRAAECNRLAEATSEPDMNLYLMKLALTWMQSATEADGKASKVA